ncbi:MAG: leucine-rich repeat domain-containing protein [Clostridia bacterium]|nr:leucine-rich repeat domain-containing protein [Clostridia bacterium]
MKTLPKLLFTTLLLTLAAVLLSACSIKFVGDKNEPPDGTPTEDQIIECDGYTLTVNGTVLKKVKFTVPGAAVKVTVPEGITEIAPDAGRMLFCAVSLTLPTTLEKYEYLTPIDFVGMDWSFPRVVEIYDLAKKFDFDLENSKYSSALKTNLKVIHKSENEPRILTEKDGFTFCQTEEETLLVGFNRHSDTLTVPAYYEGVPCAIAPYAFADARIDTVVLSEGITSVSRNCFCKTTVTEVVLPSSLKTVEKYAFSGCTRLSTVSLPEGLTRIEDSAFEHCNNLTELIFPESLEYLDCSAIDNTKITKLYIPRSLTELVVEHPYEALGNITEFTVHPENRYYSAENGVLLNKDGSALLFYPIKKADTEYTVPSTVKEISDGAFKYAHLLTDVTLPEGVEKIGKEAFSSCDALKTVTLPKTVTEIADDAFRYCESLTAFTVHPENTAYTSADGVLFNKTLTKLLTYPVKKDSAKYVLPTTVEEIAPYAFYENKHLKSVTLPEGLRSIGEAAFRNCGENGLTITFPNTLEYIGKAAFYGCDIVLTWENKGVWSVTDGKNETVTVDMDAFEDFRDAKFKYFKNANDYTLEKIKTPS